MALETTQQTTSPQPVATQSSRHPVPYKAMTLHQILPAPTLDPFAPPGVVFQPVSDQLIVARVLTAAVFTLLCAATLLALALTLNPWWWLGVGLLLALLAWEIWLARRQVRALGYAERADDLLIRRGILFRSIVVVPYGRMQYVDVTAGPLQRALGIATVRLHTAAAQTDATIPGLVPEAADALRDRLTERGQSRLQGL